MDGTSSILAVLIYQTSPTAHRTISKQKDSMLKSELQSRTLNNMLLESTACQVTEKANSSSHQNN